MRKIIKTEEGEFFSKDFLFTLPGSFPTRLDLLNWACGGEFPLGRQSTLYGEPGVGKTSLSFEIAAAYLKKCGGDLYYIEGEGKPPLGEALLKFYGITSLDRIVPKRFPSLEGVWKFLEELVTKVDEGFIIIDSLASFGADRGDNAEIDDPTRVGGEASLNTKFMKGVFFKVLSLKKIGFLIINQIRDNVGNRYGGTHLPGGKALQFSSSLEMEISLPFNGKLENTNKEIVGQDIEILVTKNILGDNYRKVILPFYYNYGFDNEESLVKLAVKRGVLKLNSKGGWIEYGGKKCRRSEVANTLRESKDGLEEIRKSLGLVPVV